MTDRTISVWVEPNYAETPWCHRLFVGIKNELARRRCKADIIVTKDSICDPEKNGIVILAGETGGWIERMMKTAGQADMRICLACADPEPILPHASTVTLDRWGDMCVMMRYLHGAGRTRIALFGVNPASPADQKRMSAYCDMAKLLQLPLGTDDIYYTFGDVKACTTRFLFQIGRYDAVIAGNDLYAIYLMPFLIDAGLIIPDQLYVAGFGNTFLSRCIKPSLTTAALDHVELGRQAVDTAFHLGKNPHITRMAVTIEGRFYARQSTANKPIVTGSSLFAPAPITTEISSYTDTYLSHVVSLELCLAGCDDLDLDIIEQLMRDQTINTIADALFLSQSTLNYRLNKLYHQAGVSSRIEFEALLRTYAPGFTADAFKQPPES